MIRKRTLFFIFLCLVPLLSCGQAQKTPSLTAKPGKVSKSDSGALKIGFSIATDTFVIERWNKDIKIFTEVAKSLGTEVIMQLSAGGTQAQIEQIEYLLGRDIDVLVVLAHDTDLLSGVIKQVNDKGIPVICYDRLIQGVAVSAYVSFDNYQVGRLFGKALTQKVPQGNYVVVNGSVKDNNSYTVNEGLHQILDPFIISGKIKLIDEIWLQEWSSDEAAEKFRQILEKTTDIDAISAGNDQLANAIINQLSELRMAADVAVVGQDADLLSCQRVIEGLQLMTVYKPIEKLATRAAQLAVLLAKGEALPDPDTYVENGSESRIPFYMEPPIAVYKDTMDVTVIKDGFHSAEAIYRNSSDY